MAAIGIAAIALTVLAFYHVRTLPEILKPAPTTKPSASAPATPSPTPSATAPETPIYDRATERFLTSTGDVLWRGIAGRCGSAEPLLERSIDGGFTWADVTPNYLAIKQLLAVAPFADGEAEIIALVGESCEVQLLRTFTQGQFWESYPDALRDAEYVNPEDPDIFVSPQGSVSAPCRGSHGMRTNEDLTAVMCGDAAHLLVRGGDWARIFPSEALAVDVVGEDAVVAHRSRSCDGITITRVSRGVVIPETPSSCVTLASPTGPIAIEVTSDQALVWSGDEWATAGLDDG
ncbi:hypothetical protein HD600_001900 [Microbacterium ginsengiterrae]|uniref:Uncharacterized protein n=1 Tax=Microbacterium ginsengiterrae TaxID=546115 RepID=A0A7W9CDB9_9MICO|nr:hypothetical protein [Microbacterium ginsengiterrae]MBB5743403.1 hypothetical protein [Microbacterium ginsengiterrae]